MYCSRLLIATFSMDSWNLAFEASHLRWYSSLALCSWPSVPGTLIRRLSVESNG